MAREFGKRSYNPEEIFFSKSGRDGKKGQPWTIVNHMLYKNIFLEAYENPQTAEELSLELGVALPYIENELEYLVREQLLTKVENKYQTAFPIISRVEQRKKYESHIKVQKALTGKLCELIDTYIGEDGSKVDFGYIGYENAKWALIVRTFDYLQRLHNDDENVKAAYPQRPDDGAWVLTGFESIDWQIPQFVGMHGYMTYDVDEMQSKIDFWQFKFNYNQICEKTPNYITYDEAYNLWLVCNGRVDECDVKHIDALLKYGYLKNDGAITPNIVIFKNFDSKVDESTSRKLSALKNEINSLFDQAPDISRGYIVEQAIADGWLKYDDNTINTIGAYIYL